MPASSRRQRKPTTLAPDRRWSCLSPPAVMPLVEKSGNVLEAARNTQRRAVGVGAGRPTCPLHGHHRPARAAIMAALARISANFFCSFSRSGPYAGGGPKCGVVSPARTRRRTWRRICRTGGRWTATPSGGGGFRVCRSQCCTPSTFRRRHVSHRVVTTAGSSEHGELGSSACLPRSRSRQQLPRNFALRFRSYEGLLSVPSAGAGRRR